MKHRISFALRATCVLTLGATLLSGCGGRFQTLREVEDDGDGSGGNSNAGRGGGVGSRAGSSSAGSSTGATSSGGASSGGAASNGAGGNCAVFKCAVPACPVGTTPVIPADGCCPVCQSTCPPCPPILCFPGSHAQVLDGCCPTCILDDATGCLEGQQAYASFRAELLNKYQNGCSSSAECTVIAPLNRCERCNYTPVWYGFSDSFDSNLANAADMYCSTCAQEPVPPCVPPSPVACVNRQCQFAGLK